MGLVADLATSTIIGLSMVGRWRTPWRQRLPKCRTRAQAELAKEQLTNVESRDGCDVVGYAFDWDDNILYMPSKIHMVKSGVSGSVSVALSTAEFAEQRLDPHLAYPNGDASQAFKEFSDDVNPNQFAEHAIHAIEANKFAPSFPTWKAALLAGHPWAIITARAHQQNNLRAGVKQVIESVLTESEREAMQVQLRRRYVDFGDATGNECILDTYLRHCHFYGVGNQECQEALKKWALRSWLMNHPPGFIQQPSDCARRIDETSSVKQFAFAKFTEACQKIAVGMTLSVGFSDDDEKNVAAIGKHMEELTCKIPDVKLVLYSSSPGHVEKREVFHGGKKVWRRWWEDDYP